MCPPLLTRVGRFRLMAPTTSPSPPPLPGPFYLGKSTIGCVRSFCREIIIKDPPANSKKASNLQTEHNKITRGTVGPRTHFFFFFWLCFFFSLVQLFFEPAEEKNRVLIHSDATTEPARISAVLCLRPLSGGTFSAAKKKKTYFTLDLSTSKKSWKTDTSGRQIQRFFFGFLGDRIAGFNFFVFVRNE